IADGTGVGTIANDDIAPPPPAAAAVAVNITSSWGSGYVAEVTVRNTGSTPLTNWVLEFDAPFRIADIWNADQVSHTGTRYRLQAKSYNASIPPGGSVTFGFRADGAASAWSNVLLNGVPADVS